MISEFPKTTCLTVDLHIRALITRAPKKKDPQFMEAAIWLVSSVALHERLGLCRLQISFNFPLPCAVSQGCEAAAKSFTHILIPGVHTSVWYIHGSFSKLGILFLAPYMRHAFLFVSF